MIQKTFVVACKEFFGFKPGQGLQDFAAEVKALSPKDRADLVGEFAKIGIEIVVKPGA
jgi:hypothetical protein